MAPIGEPEELGVKQLFIIPPVYRKNNENHKMLELFRKMR